MLPVPFYTSTIWMDGYYVSASQVLLVLLAISCQLCEGQNLVNICQRESMDMATRDSLIVQSPGYPGPSKNRNCELKLQNIPRYSLIGINVTDESYFGLKSKLKVDGNTKAFSGQKYTEGTLLYNKYFASSSRDLLLGYRVRSKSSKFKITITVESTGCSTEVLTSAGMNFKKSSKLNSVTTTCRPGYTRLTNSMEVVCERNGQWSGLRPCTKATPSTMPTTVLVTTSLTTTTTIAPSTAATALVTTAVLASTSSMMSTVAPHTPPNMISNRSTILVSPTTTTISSVIIVPVTNISNVESNGGTNDNPFSQPEAKNSKQTISENSNEATLYGSIGGGGGAAIVLIVVAVVVILFRRRQQRFSDTKQNNRTKSRLATTNPAYERNLYVADADGVIQGHVIKETQYYEAEPVGTRRTDVYDNTHGLVNKSSTPDLDDYDVPAAVDVNYDVPAAVDDNYDVPAAVDVNYDVPAVEQEDYYNLSFTKKTAEQASNITDIYAEVNKPNREKDNHEADTLVEMIDNDLYDVTQ